MLEIDKLSVHFSSFSLHEVSLKVNKGEYLALLGLSGAGKTVLLELLAGLITPVSGRILLNGKDISHHSIQERGLGLVYQDMALFPHLKVYQNIAYALHGRGLSGSSRQNRVHELARLCACDHLLDRYPETLSGGEARRVAIARTLAAEPRWLLLDEPLANLDIDLRSGLRHLLKQIHGQGISFIHVTHDYADVATLATRVAVIENGRLIQEGLPGDVFGNPASAFVARFSGMRNLFPCHLEDVPHDAGLSAAMLDSGAGPFYLIRPPEHKPGKKPAGFISIPEQDITVSGLPLDSSAVNQIQADVIEMRNRENRVELILQHYLHTSLCTHLSLSSAERLGLRPGKKVWLSFKASAVRFLES